MSHPRRFWGTRLAEGVKPANLVTFYVAAFATIAMAVLVNALQPYLLTTFLGLPIREHGSATGSIIFANELVLLAAIGFWGVLSDRLGRRSVFAVGFVIMAAGFALTPLSRTLSSLIAFRVLYAVGIAATTAMLATVVADYVVNEDRGKANAITGIANGLGATLGALALAKLPQLFAAQGQDGIAAGWSSYSVAAILCVVVAVAIRAGLKRRDVAPRQTKAEKTPLSAMARQGLAAGRDPGVLLSYISAFVARADLAIAGVFLPLWLSKHFVAELGAAPSTVQLDAAAAQGVASGGALIGIIGAGGLLFAPIMGTLCDRINRVTALAIGLSINAVGYGLISFVGDPTGGFIKFAAVIIGFGQVGGVISSQVLVQQQAPAKLRGSVIGVFGVCGALGIMFSTLVGGALFDHWMSAGPFALLAGLNFVAAILAMTLARRISPADVGIVPGGAPAAG